MSDKPCKKIDTVYELNYIGIAMDDFYERNKITPQIEKLRPIPMESNWSLRPFFSGPYISRFRILQGDKEVSIVLQMFNTFEKCIQPYYGVLPLERKKQDNFTHERRFGTEQVEEIHNYIKNIFYNWW